MQDIYVLRTVDSHVIKGSKNMYRDVFGHLDPRIVISNPQKTLGHAEIASTGRVPTHA